VVPLCAWLDLPRGEAGKGAEDQHMRQTLRVRVRLAAVAALTALATTGFTAPSAQAVVIDPSCLYPLNTPSMSLGLSTTAPIAGQPVYMKGRLRFNNCGVKGRPTTIRVGGAVAGTRTTDTFGYYAYRLAPLAATSVSASSSVDTGQTVLPASTRSISLSVRTNLRALVTTARSCRLKVSGTTYPLKRGATIYVQRRITRKGKFLGWSTVVTTRTGTTGTWAASAKLPCGSRVGISAYIKAVSGNAAGRTPTVTVTIRR